MERIYLNPWPISGSSGMFGTPSPIMLQKQKKSVIGILPSKSGFAKECGMIYKHSQPNHDTQLVNNVILGPCGF